MSDTNQHSVLHEVDAYMGNLTERPYDHVEAMVWDLAAALRSTQEQLEAARSFLTGINEDADEALLRMRIARALECLGGSNPASSQDGGWHESAAHTPVLQPLGACGLVSADGRYACIKDIGHEGPHGSDPASEPKEGA